MNRRTLIKLIPFGFINKNVWAFLKYPDETELVYNELVGRAIGHNIGHSPKYVHSTSILFRGEKRNYIWLTWERFLKSTITTGIIYKGDVDKIVKSIAVRYNVQIKK